MIMGKLKEYFDGLFGEKIPVNCAWKAGEKVMRIDKDTYASVFGTIENVTPSDYFLSVTVRGTDGCKWMFNVPRACATTHWCIGEARMYVYAVGEDAIKAELLSHIARVDGWKTGRERVLGKIKDAKDAAAMGNVADMLRFLVDEELRRFEGKVRECSEKVDLYDSNVCRARAEAEAMGIKIGELG